jgi:hypothetical protein
MAKNASFDRARKAKQDEFYTQLTDIEREMRYFKQHFRDKTVLCNCDDPFESNFFKYFVLNFNRLGLKKLIATCYAGSPIMGTQLKCFCDENGQMAVTMDSAGTLKVGEISKEEVRQDARRKKGVNTNETKRPYKAIVTQVYDKTGDGGVDMIDVAELFKSGENQLTELEGDGDFRSSECLELLDESDIVATNPPFSLFREYISTLMEHGKSFIIIGSTNAITMKEIFPLLQSNQMWLGAPFQSGNAYFYIPNGVNTTQYAKGVYDPETRRVKFRNCCWYTNLDFRLRHEKLILVKKYSPEAYPKYANYDAVEVSKVSDIPYDYDGEMGVPITFLDKYNPEQFEIIGGSRWLGRPMSEIAPKGSYVAGGVRFYLPIKECSQVVNVEREKREERGEERRSVRYRCLYDRIVIKRRTL